MILLISVGWVPPYLPPSGACLCLGSSVLYKPQNAAEGYTTPGLRLFRCPLGTLRAEWAAKARKLDNLGYSVLTVPDHLTDLLAPLPVLVSAAEAPTHLHVGTNVLNNDLRHPVLVAREAATVDLLTDSRFQLGLGAGHMQAEYDQAGLGFDAAGIRVARLAKAVIIIKGLFTGAPVTFAGQHYHVTGHQLHPLPVQHPHPPLLTGSTAGDSSRSPRSRGTRGPLATVAP